MDREKESPAKPSCGLQSCLIKSNFISSDQQLFTWTLPCLSLMGDKQHCSVFVCVWETPWRRQLSLRLGLEIQPSLPVSPIAMWLNLSWSLSLPSSQEKKTGEKFSLLIRHFVPHLFPPSREDGWMGWELGWGRERKLNLCIIVLLYQWRRGSRSWGTRTSTYTLETPLGVVSSPSLPN